MLLYRTKNVQLFAFSPNPNDRFSGYGLHLRWRQRLRYWNHYKIIVLARPRKDLRKGRGTVTYEFNSWSTSPGVSAERVTLKAGVRLKFMFGGPRPVLVPIEEDEDELDDE